MIWLMHRIVKVHDVMPSRQLNDDVRSEKVVALEETGDKAL